MNAIQDIKRREAKQKRAKAAGRALLRARARAGHTAQQLHNLIAAKGFAHPPTVRTIQRHEDGDMLPWRSTWVMYVEVYPELEGRL